MVVESAGFFTPMLRLVQSSRLWTGFLVGFVGFFSF